MSCRTCNHWWEHEGDDADFRRMGFCYRFPPAFVGNFVPEISPQAGTLSPGRGFAYPVVGWDSRCGEWEVSRSLVRDARDSVD